MDSVKHDVMNRRNFLKAGAVTTFIIAADLTPSAAKTDASEYATENPNQTGFLYDQKKCVNCKICVNSCKSAMKWEEGTEWRRLLLSQKKPGCFLSISCNHCEKPDCVSVCPVKAYAKRKKDGAVIHDRDVCIGCKYCMYACPYGAPQFSKSTKRISKCHFCFERLDKGEEPVCVSMCPMGALSFGLLKDIKKIPGAVSQLGKMPNPELTKPSLAIIPKL